MAGLGIPSRFYSILIIHVKAAADVMVSVLRHTTILSVLYAISFEVCAPCKCYQGMLFPPTGSILRCASLLAPERLTVTLPLGNKKFTCRLPQCVSSLARLSRQSCKSSPKKTSSEVCGNVQDSQCLNHWDKLFVVRMAGE